MNVLNERSCPITFAFQNEGSRSIHTQFFKVFELPLGSKLSLWTIVQVQLSQFVAGISQTVVKLCQHCLKYSSLMNFFRVKNCIVIYVVSALTETKYISSDTYSF